MMKNILRTVFAGSLFIFFVASPIMAVATPQTAAAAGPACEQRLLGIPPWYRGMTKGTPPNCVIKSPGEVGGLSDFIWRIVLNGIEMALVATVYITVGFILYGGFLFMTGGAVPAQLEKARKTLINAVVGLVIALSAVALTNLVFSIIG